MLKRLVFRFGSNPLKSWARFKIGLGLFFAGAILLYAGAIWWMYLQIPAVIAMLTGFIFAALGYAGIFANRFSQVINRSAHPGATDKSHTHQE